MWRWRAEPVGGNRREIASYHSIACLLCNSKTLLLIIPGSPAICALMLWASLRAPGGRLSEQSSRAGCPHSSSYGSYPYSYLLWFLQYLWIYRWAPQKCWDKPKSLFHCPLADMTISWLWDWNTQTHMPCLLSLLRQRSHVGDVYVKHIKASEVFP